MVERHDAGMSRLHHANLNTGPQPHFVEAADEVRLPLNVKDFPGFAGIQEVHWNNMWHVVPFTNARFKTET